jgi:hypothetical protein
MLSTLPQEGQVDDPEGIWPEGYDPWAELAERMLLEIAEHGNGLLPLPRRAHPSEAAAVDQP